MSRTRSPCRVLVVALLFAAWPLHAAERDRFVFELDGIPVGTVELAVNGQTYSYGSTHFFARGRQGYGRGASFVLREDGRDWATGDVLESHWLWTRPKVGCQRVRSEIGGRRALGCIQRIDGDYAFGTLGEDAFRAEYEGGRLRVLSLGRATFSRVEGNTTLPTPPPLFGEGWPVEGRRGNLRIEGFPTAASTISPAPSGDLRAWKSRSSARALARSVRRQFREDARASCVDYVRAFAEASSRRGLGDVFIVHGLVAERRADRAFPHVWVRVPLPGGWLELDPSLGIAVTPETHVSLAEVSAGDATGDAGRVWLSFTASAATIVRADRHP